MSLGCQPADQCEAQNPTREGMVAPQEGNRQGGKTMRSDLDAVRKKICCGMFRAADLFDADADCRPMVE